MAGQKINGGEGKPKWDARRIVVAVLAFAMAVLMLLPLVTNVFLFSHAVTKEDIEALRQQKQSIANQQAEAQKELDALAQQENSFAAGPGHGGGGPGLLLADPVPVLKLL